MLQPIFWLIPGTYYQKIGFRVLVPPIITINSQWCKRIFFASDVAPYHCNTFKNNVLTLGRNFFRKVLVTYCVARNITEHLWTWLKVWNTRRNSSCWLWSWFLIVEWVSHVALCTFFWTNIGDQNILTTRENIFFLKWK